MGVALNSGLRDRLNFDGSVRYHYDQFPPTEIDFSRLIGPIASAAAALARYDQMLRSMHNSELLLGPLQRQEAVVSSRMEGTVSTLDEVLRYEADQGEEEGDAQSTVNHRNETVEVFLYARAMKNAQKSMEDGVDVSDWLIRSTHSSLLSIGRGANKSPGQYKNEQNYIVDRDGRSVLFEPISPEHLPYGMEKLLFFIHGQQFEPLLRTAIAHVEFEALHPFKDGNGRIGRILITLLLWRQGIISAPHFYISSFFEEKRDEYLMKMRNVSKDGAWTEWCLFFLEALEAQAFRNIETAENITKLYEEMKGVFRDTLRSSYHINALDFVFGQPVFRNNSFVSKSGIPKQTASRFSRKLTEEGLLSVLVPASGRRPAMYVFEPLMQILRS